MHSRTNKGGFNKIWIPTKIAYIEYLFNKKVKTPFLVPRQDNGCS